MTSNAVRLHLVDGTFELYRAHYSRRPEHLAPDGRPLKATLGLADSMLALLADPAEAVTHLGIAFDNPIRSFRNDLFSDYKSDEGVPDELRAQFDEVEVAARALGLTVWSMNQFEADDALATAAARWRDAVQQVRILSPDKDLGQCFRGRQVVGVDRIRRLEIDEAAFRARRGFNPGSMPDFLALVGDTADGIPGLKGFGERTAGRLLARFEHLEAIPSSADGWPTDIRGGPALAMELSTHQTEVLLYRKLATLVEDVPLKESLEDLKWRGVTSELDAWCARVGAKTLRDRPRPVPRAG